MIDIIFNSIIFIFTCFSINNFNTFLLILSIDNFSYALDFIINNINKSLTYHDIIFRNNKVYKIGLVERYIYYIFIAFLYYFIKILILDRYVYVLKILISLMSIPYIFNQIIYENFKDYFDKLCTYKDKIIKLLVCEQIYNIIEKINKKYLNEKIILNKSDIIMVLEKCDLKSELLSFIKNFLIVSLLNYCKTKSFLYYKLIKYVYIYNSGKYYINNINEEEAINKFIDIFKNKQYNKLNEPMTIHSLLQLYYIKNSNTDMNELNNIINYKIISFMTLWTFGSFFNDIYRLFIIIISSILIKFTRFTRFEKYDILLPTKKNNKVKGVLTDVGVKTPEKINISKKIIYFLELGVIKDYSQAIVSEGIDKNLILSNIITIIFYNISQNIIFLSLLNQFGYYIFINFITKGICKTFYNNIINKIILNLDDIINIVHNDIILFIKNIIYSILIKYLFEINAHYGYVFILIIMNLEKNNIQKILYSIYYLSGINRNHIIKLIILSYSGSILINMYRNIEKIKNIFNKNTNNIIRINKINNIEEELRNAMENDIN